MSVGFSVGGAADSESSYLVEGQDTENISGGASQANVPFEFIQEVQVKTSGIEAEHGGALGGVVNVVMKKGSNAYHGSVFRHVSNPMRWMALRTPPCVTIPLQYLSLQVLTMIRRPTRRRKTISVSLSPALLSAARSIKDRLWFFLGFCAGVQCQNSKCELRPVALRQYWRLSE